MIVFGLLSSKDIKKSIVKNNINYTLENSGEIELFDYFLINFFTTKNLSLSEIKDTK